MSKVKVLEVRPEHRRGFSRPTLRVEVGEKEEGGKRMRCQGVPEKGPVYVLPLPKANPRQRVS